MADIASCDDATEREIKWLLYYNDKYDELPSKELQSVMEKALLDPSLSNIKDVITDQEMYKKMVQTMGQQAADQAMIRGVNRLVAQEIVKATIGGAKSAAGRRGAVVVVEESAKLAAARGANVAVNGIKAIASLPVGLSAAIGEMVGDIVADSAGVKNHHARNMLGAGGAMAGGAAAGALVGGPVGALAGAGVGAGSWLVGQGIKAVTRTIGSSDKNRCCIDIGDIGEVKLCVGTYTGSDTMYWKTYWNEYKKSNNSWEMSAGQKQSDAFQLCIWKGRKVIKHFNVVYHRDLIGIIMKNGKFMIVHCKGPFHPEGAGKVSSFEI